MKKLFVLAVMLILQASIVDYESFAQAPKKMNYQGGARDAEGNLMLNKTITLRLNIISGADINTPVYSELQTTKTNTFGLFSLKIGEGEVVSGSMDDIDWSSGDHFIAVEMDVDNSGHFVAMGLSQLLSVPYAFYAEKAGTAKDVENISDFRAIDFGGTAGQTIHHDGSDWVATSSLFNSGSNVGVGTTTPSAKLDVDGGVNLSTGNEFSVNGTRALALNGNQNVMIGHQAGNSVTIGKRNLFIGWQAGRDVNTGENNTMMGYRAGFVTTDGRNNNMIGNLAGFTNTIGNNNSFIGYRAGYSNTVGLNNFYAGTNAGHNGTTGTNNLALGTAAGFSLGAGNDNSLIGRNAGYNTTGDANVFIGKEAGITNITGSNNTYLGTNADGVDSLTNATAIGANTTVNTSNSVVLGNNANIGIGTNAPADKLHVKGNLRLDSARVTFANTNSNIYIGEGAGANHDFSTPRNLGIGYQSLYAITTGTNNIALGAGTLNDNTSGEANTAVGAYSLLDNTTGSLNTSIGSNALAFNTSGFRNTGVGAITLVYNTTGSYNTGLGWGANVDTQDLVNATAIGANSTVACDSCLVLGDASKVGIGTTTPADKLHVVGNIRMIDGNQAAGYVPVSDANGTMSWTDPTTISDGDWTVNDTNMYTAVSGNVGVGTTNPGYKLHLKDGDMMVQEGKIQFSNSKNNTYIGTGAGGPSSGISASGSVAVGHQALNSNTNGIVNLAVGAWALMNTTTGGYNVALGSDAIRTNTTGRSNIGVGYGPLYKTTTGSFNVAVGETSLFNNETGDYNVAVGTTSMLTNTSGRNNTVIGSLSDVLSGDLRNATAIGANSRVGCDSCLVLGDASNVGIGTTSPADKLHLVGDMRLDAGRIDVRNTGGSVIIGEKAGLVDDFSLNRNVFIGYESGEETTTGTENTAVGPYSLSSNTTGNLNTGLGKSASAKNTSGNENVAVGKFALFENQTGSNNTAIGANALDYGGTADANNTALGFEAGWNADGSNNVYLGYRAGKAKPGSNRLFIENSAADSTNALIYGRFDNNILALNANVGVGTTNPLTRLHVQGGSASFGWSPFSQTSAIFEQNAGSILSIISGNTAVSSITMGDTDAQFRGRVRYEHTDDRMEFWTANTEQVSILSNGNVGIGSTTPADKLHVEGSIRMVDGNQGDGKVLTSDANGTASWQSSSSVPVGTVVMYMGDEENIPDGWLLCDGGSFSAATYPELQTVMGGTNTPNLKGRFPLGAKPIASFPDPTYNLKSTGGAHEVTLTEAQMPSHTHNVTVTFREAEEQGSGNNYSDLNGGSSDSRTYESASAGSDQPFDNMPPYYAVNFIIKAN